jgi:hypothetical protein
MGFLAKLGGRKFILAVFGVIAIALHSWLGIDVDAVITIGGVIASFLVGQGIADGLSGGATSSTPPKQTVSVTTSTSADGGTSVTRVNGGLIPILVIGLLCFSGCDSADIMNHVQGGVSVNVDPITGAITPNVSVVIKDARGRTLHHIDAGVPVTPAEQRAFYRAGGRAVSTCPSCRESLTNSFKGVQAAQARALAMCPDEKGGLVRSIESGPIAEAVEIRVTPSMREQLRNIVMLRDRTYIRNNRPVERALERAAQCAILESVPAVVSTPAAPPATPQIPSFDPGGFSIPADKAVNTLDARVEALERDVKKILAAVEAKK